MAASAKRRRLFVLGVVDLESTSRRPLDIIDTHVFRETPEDYRRIRQIIAEFNRRIAADPSLTVGLAVFEIGIKLNAEPFTLPPGTLEEGQVQQ